MIAKNTITGMYFKKQFGFVVTLADADELSAAELAVVRASYENVEAVARMVKASEMEATGTAGTTTSPSGGIGFGYRLGTTIYQNGGNGWFYIRENYRFLADAGAAYKDVIRGKRKHAEVLAAANAAA